eukprot:scaffold40876_cov29-Tisochrysis_lutea.AAC.3
MVVPTETSPNACAVGTRARPMLALGWAEERSARPTEAGNAAEVASSYAGAAVGMTPALARARQAEKAIIGGGTTRASALPRRAADVAAVATSAPPAGRGRTIRRRLSGFSFWGGSSARGETRAGAPGCVGLVPRAPGRVRAGWAWGVEGVTEREVRLGLGLGEKSRLTGHRLPLLAGPTADRSSALGSRCPPPPLFHIM